MTVRSSASRSRSLAPYRATRDFTVTDEPRGGDDGEASAAGGRYVVQRHRARRLHYDLRLELAGVLVSWAVPKGPTLDADVRRLAVHIEDHPVEYFDYEGIIAAGQYGGGDVIVWDWGWWTPAPDRDDPASGLADGSLHVDLHGVKLNGRFALARTARGGAKEQWLLIHKHDDHAVSGWDAEDHPRSVRSGRTNNEVLEDDEVRRAGTRLTRSDLYERARRRGLPGRSTCNRDELAAALGLP